MNRFKYKSRLEEEKTNERVISTTAPSSKLIRDPAESGILKKGILSRAKAPKETQIELRRHRVFTMWLWGYKQTIIAKELGVNRDTILEDMKVIKTWPETKQVTIQELKTKLELRLDDLMRGMKEDLDCLEDPSLRLHQSCKFAMVLIEMWKKLMPIEAKPEKAADRKPISISEWYKKQEELEERARKRGSKSTGSL